MLYSSYTGSYQYEVLKSASSEYMKNMQSMKEPIYQPTMNAEPINAAVLALTAAAASLTLTDAAAARAATRNPKFTNPNTSHPVASAA